MEFIEYQVKGSGPAQEKPEFLNPGVGSKLAPTPLGEM